MDGLSMLLFVWSNSSVYGCRMVQNTQSQAEMDSSQSSGTVFESGDCTAAKLNGEIMKQMHDTASAVGDHDISFTLMDGGKNQPRAAADGE